MRSGGRGATFDAASNRKLLSDAEIMLDAGLNEAAGRTAYLAGFHMAQAPIFERLGKVFKSHNGVQTEFLRLTKDDTVLPSIAFDV
jgi:uncharacterized protein (UPF0332 family)